MCTDHADQDDASQRRVDAPILLRIARAFEAEGGRDVEWYLSGAGGAVPDLNEVALVGVDAERFRRTCLVPLVEMASGTGVRHRPTEVLRQVRKGEGTEGRFPR
jgi:hypothetical protein